MRKITKHSEYLKPQVDDIVIFKDSKGMKKFGKIVSIDSNQLVSLICLHHGTKITRQFHILLLNLLFRKQEWIDDVPAKCHETSKPDEEGKMAKRVSWTSNEEVIFQKEDPPARLQLTPVAPNSLPNHV